MKKRKSSLSPTTKRKGLFNGREAKKRDGRPPQEEEKTTQCLERKKRPDAHQRNEKEPDAGYRMREERSFF